ncbi:putative alginate regulatory protein AlgP, partial [human gut metagenome]
WHAERQAEREALLTGQQPLLTRRELKRLREEAEALRAAVDAGEITLEQAKALQDPLADQPNVDVPSLSATGT